MLKILPTFVVMALSAAFSVAQDTLPAVADADKHRLGNVTFSVPGVKSSVFARVMADIENKNFSTPNPFVQEKKGEDVSYNISVPENYTPEEPFGLLIWISPGDGGGVPSLYRELLTKYKLIGIGAANSGNKHSTVYRAGYAVQAVELMKQRYSIDQDRVYVSGHSGGGRVTSYVMMLYPEVFSGGLPVCGANIMFDVTVENSGIMKGLSGFSKSRLRRPAEFGRYAFLTGEKDFNKKDTKLAYSTYAKLGFNYLTYVEEPGLGHKVVSAKTMSNAIEFVDSALPVIAANKYKGAGKLARSQPGNAILAYQAAIRHGQEAPWISQAEKKIATLVEKYGAYIQRFKKSWGQFASDDIKQIKNQ